MVATVPPCSVKLYMKKQVSLLEIALGISAATRGARLSLAAKV
jgi:hypothetical protein